MFSTIPLPLNQISLQLHLSLTGISLTLQHGSLAALRKPTHLRLSSAPPTTTKLFSARIFSRKSSMASGWHCREFWPMTNRTGVFISKRGSILSMNLSADFWPKHSQLEFIKCNFVIVQVFKAHFKNKVMRQSDAFWFLKSFLWIV